VTQLGEMLKAAREEQNLSLRDVEKAIHIRQHLLAALEENNLKVFPSPVIIRGLIRNYAKFLNLDPLEALMLYDGNGIIPVKGHRRTASGIEFMNLSMTSRRRINWEFVIWGALFLIVMGVGGFLTYGTVIQPLATATPTKTPRSTGITEDSALVLPTVTPPPTNTATPLPPTDTTTPIVFTGVNVELVIRQASWVQILADDVKVFEGILQPDTNRSWTGQRRVAIRAGNGGGVEVIVNGINRGLMGAEGQVVDQLWEKVDNPSELAPTNETPAFFNETLTPTGEVGNETPPPEETPEG